MMFKNPVTNEEFETSSEYVDSLAASWRDLLKRKLPIAKDEASLIDAMDAMAGAPEVKTGTLTLEGIELLVRIKRGQNASYEREPGKEHPIIRLIEQCPFLEDYYRMEIKESGRKVDRLLETFEEEKGLKKKEVRAIEKIKELRIVREAKPQIAITERTQ